MSLASDTEARRLAVMGLLDAPTEDAALNATEWLSDTDWRVRKEAVRVVAALPPNRRVPPVLVAAISQAPDVGLRNAALELVSLLRGQMTSPLMRALENLGGNTTEELSTRRFLIEGLGKTRDHAAVPALTKLTNSADANVAALSVDALARIGGDAAEQAVRAQLSTTRAYQKFAVIDALTRMDAEVSWEELAPICSDPMLLRSLAPLLARSNSESALEPLLRALGNASGSGIEEVVVALGQFLERHESVANDLDGFMRTLPATTQGKLIRLLVHGSLECRQVATALLLRTRKRDSLTPVISAIGRDGVTPLALSALGSWGNDLLPLLLKLSEGENEVAATALEVASDVAAMSCDPAQRSAVRERLLQALQLDSVTLAKAAASSLVWCAEPTDAKVLLAAASRFDASLASACADCLVKITERSPEAVRDALRDAPPPTANTASLMRVMAVLPGRESVDSLSSALGSAAPEVRRSAVKALAVLGTPGVEEYVGLALADEDPSVRVAAAVALSGIGADAAGTRQLLSALESTDPALVVASARALGRVGGDSAIPSLIRLVESPDDSVVAAALAALVQLSASNLGPILMTHIGHPKKEVVKQCLEGLVLLSEPRAAEQLAVGLSHEAWDVRQLAASLLGQLGDIESVPALKRCLGVEEDNLVRAAISTALVKLEHQRSNE